MKKLYILLLLATVCILPFVARAGGPDAEIDAHVNGVEVGDNFITFAVYGEARIFAPKTSEEMKRTADKGNAHMVGFRFENQYLVIHRDKEAVPGFTANWEELKERAVGMRDKEGFFQVWGAKITIEHGMVTRIDAKEVSFRERGKD